MTEEIYVREALKLGLDRDDTVIRRRLRQKMEFLTDAEVGAIRPTDAELESYLAAHPDAFPRRHGWPFSRCSSTPTGAAM